MIPFKLRLIVFIVFVAGCAGNLKVAKKENEGLKELEVYSLSDRKGRVVAKIRAVDPSA